MSVSSNTAVATSEASVLSSVPITVPLSSMVSELSVPSPVPVTVPLLSTMSVHYVPPSMLTTVPVTPISANALSSREDSYTSDDV